MLHVSIKPETVFFFQGLSITNSLLTSFFVTAIMLLIGLYFSANINSQTSKFVTLMRFMLTSLHDMFKTILGDLHEKAFPLLLSFFFYILISNWFGLLPGVGSITITPPAHEAEASTHEEDTKVEKSAPVVEEGETVEEHAAEEAHGKIPLLRGTTADLNATIALALIAFAAIQYFGFTTLGIVGYAKKFINFSNPINFFIGVLELISEFSKILSFAFRLFGNIFAGEVLLTVMAFLVPILASFPFLILEIFVGFVQAIVFSMLTGVFISSAVASHDDHH